MVDRERRIPNLPNPHHHSHFPSNFRIFSTPNKLRGVGLGMGIFNQFETICDVIITLLHYYALFGY